jgi:hypothetical protein
MKTKIHLFARIQNWFIKRKLKRAGIDVDKLVDDIVREIVKQVQERIVIEHVMLNGSQLLFKVRQAEAQEKARVN